MDDSPRLHSRATTPEQATRPTPEPVLSVFAPEAAAVFADAVHGFREESHLRSRLVPQQTPSTPGKPPKRS